MPDPFAIVALVAGSAAVAGAAGRLGLSSPLVLTGVGILVSYVPGVPDFPLSPEVALVGFLPPLLYTAAIRTPFIDMRRNKRPIGLLSVALVLVTAFAVAGVAMLALPGLPLAAAVALGAVVAPPDAVAATTVARRVGMPRRVVTILEGESLFNDATALVALRMAVAAIGGTVTVAQIAGDFVLAVLLGALAGWVVAELASVVRRRVVDPVLDTSLSLVVPYAAYLAAEQVHGSGVLAVVVAGLVLGHRSPEIQSAASRVTERTIWRTVQFLLESVVFALIGLQLKGLLDAARASEVSSRTILWCVLAVVATVVVVRIVWVFPATYLSRLVPSVARGEPRPAASHVALVSWAGMRGVVTLAAAFSLPPGTPFREVLLVTAFGVVAGTLLVQGTSLRFVVRLLRVQGPDAAQDALQQALVMQRAVGAGRARLDEVAGPGAPSETVASLRLWGERLAHSVWERLGRSRPDEETPAAAFRRLRIAMLAAEREVVVAVHRSGKVPADVLQGVLERLDEEEALLSSFATSDAPTSDDVLRAPHHAPGCEHLTREPALTVPTTPDACEDCVALGERTWVALRMCVRCGHVACCDSSPNRHAEAHFHTTQHPVIRSIELGEAWRWCYVDSTLG